ncbi:esterase/lipase family protein [Rhodococcus sp. NPDC004095]
MTNRLRSTTTGIAAVAVVALGIAIVPTATVSAQSSTGSSATEFVESFKNVTGSVMSQPHEQGVLPGVNEDCTPSPEHPRPVVLVHGTALRMQKTWGNVHDPSLPGPLVEALRADGYCLYALNYGYATSTWVAGIPGPSGWGHGSITESAKDLADFIDRVRERTGSTQVDVVGHSQAGPLTRRYLLAEGGADPANPANNKVHTLVMLGPSNHGTTFWADNPADAKRAGASIAGQQQTPGSEFLTELNAAPETLPGIEYTVIATTKDDRVFPYESSFLIPAPGTEQSVHQMTVQEVCGDPDLAVSHARYFPPGLGNSVGLLDHSVPQFLVRQALDPTLPGTPPC